MDMLIYRNTKRCYATYWLFLAPKSNSIQSNPILWQSKVQVWRLPRRTENMTKSSKTTGRCAQCDHICITWPRWTTSNISMSGDIETLLRQQIKNTASQHTNTNQKVRKIPYSSATKLVEPTEQASPKARMVISLLLLSQPYENTAELKFRLVSAQYHKDVRSNQTILQRTINVKCRRLVPMQEAFYVAMWKVSV